MHPRLGLAVKTAKLAPLASAAMPFCLFARILSGTTEIFGSSIGAQGRPRNRANPPNPSGTGERSSMPGMTGPGKEGVALLTMIKSAPNAALYSAPLACLSYPYGAELDIPSTSAIRVLPSEERMASIRALPRNRANSCPYSSNMRI